MILRVWLALVGVLLLLPRVALGQTVLVDFEDRPVDVGLFRQIHGVTFRGGDSSPPQTRVVEPVAGALSGERAVLATRRGEFVGSGLEIVFDEGQGSVKLSVGLEPDAVEHSGLLVVLNGYDTPNPTNEQRQNPLVSSPIASLGSAPRAVDTPLEITSDDDDIVLAEVVILSADWETTFPPSPDQVAVLVDNLEYRPPTDPPVPDVVPPAIVIETPAEGATVEGVAPGALETFVRGFVDEAGGLRAMTLQLNDGGPVSVSHDGNFGGRYRFLATLFGRTGLVDGDNAIVLRAEDFDGNVSTATRRFVYAMRPVPPPTDVDLVPIAVELNQAVSFGPMSVLAPEADGFSARVPDFATYVQDTDTLVRVYAVAEGATAPVPDVPAALVVMRRDCASQCRLGELSPLRSATRIQPGITVRPAGATGSSLDELSRSLGDTWNFLIPAAWTSEPLRLLIDINTPTAATNPVIDRANECVADFLGECERGNRLTVDVDFRAQHVATVNPILVHFQGEFDGATIDEIPDSADIATLVSGLNDLYPTRFDLGPIRTITVDPNVSGGDLLGRLQDRFGCRAPDITSPSSWLACGTVSGEFNVALVTRTFDLGAGGLANLGNNTVWARVSRTTPAHEVGHAIGFAHASCDHDEASGGTCDDYYPGDHGRIEGIGFDRAAWMLQVDDATSHVHDFMSYGSPRWVSRYMWEITADHPYHDDVGYDWCLSITGPYRCGLGQADELRAAPPVPEGPVLHVSAQLDADGLATFDDAYLLPRGGRPASIRAGAPTWRLLALDPVGNTMASLEVEPRDTLGGERPAARLEVELPVPDGDLDLDRLELWSPEGDRVGELVARSADLPVVGDVDLGGAGRWTRDEVRTIAWTMPEGTTARVELQPDGEPGRILASQLAAPSLELRVSELPGTPAARIVVRVSDGVHTGLATSERFEIEPGPPQVHILEPSGPTTLSVGAPVSLLGAAASDRGPLDPGTLHWTSDTLGDLGRGHRAGLGTLPEGVHVVTLTVDDGERTASTSVELTVTAAGSPDDGKGCGCSSGAPGVPWLALIVLGVLVIRRRPVWLGLGLAVACAGPEPSRDPDPTTDPAPVDTADPSVETFEVGGVVEGLTGAGLVLQLDGSASLAIDADGSFVFDGALPVGAAYEVYASRWPTCPQQACDVEGGLGTVTREGGDVEVVVRCRPARDRVVATSGPGDELWITDTLETFADLDVASPRIVQDASATLGPIAADPARQTLYVGTAEGVRVYADPLGLVDEAPPDRAFVWREALFGPVDSVAYDPDRDRLYAAVGDVVAAFDGASELDGEVEPTDELVAPMDDGSLALAVDPERDLLYATHRRGDLADTPEATVWRWADASKPSTPEPSRTLTFFTRTADARFDLALAVDRCTNRLYALQQGRTTRGLMVLDGATGFSGRINIDDDLSSYADFADGVELVFDGQDRLVVLRSDGSATLLAAPSDWQGPVLLEGIRVDGVADDGASALALHPW